MDDFSLLDIINYLGLGVSYESWVKAYCCEAGKSWFPYEWFDSVDKLDYPEFFPYSCFCLKLKGQNVFLLADWKHFKQLWQDQGMQTMVDWLCHCNN